jgi:dTDP-4-amino-4,6-dideoxygalactose transaminase
VVTQNIHVGKAWLNDNYGPGATFIANRASGLLFSFLKALGREGTGVIIPASSCHALAQTVILANYIPVFADIEIHDLNMSLSNLLVAHSNSDCEVSVCIAVHSYGNFCVLDEIQKYCLENEIILVEDACQLTGSGHEGRSGDIVLTSFGYSKPINIGGGGGMLIRSPLLQNLESSVQDSDDAEPSFPAEGSKFKSEYYSLRNLEFTHEISRGLLNSLTSKYTDFILHGGSLPLWNEFTGQIKSLNNRNMERRRKAKILSDALSNVPGIQLLQESPISVPWRYSFLVKDADHQLELTSNLRSEINHVSNWYPNLALDFLGRNAHNTPNSTKVEKSIINVWIDDVANAEYLSKTIEIITTFFRTGIRK